MKNQIKKWNLALGVLLLASQTWGASTYHSKQTLNRWVMDLPLNPVLSRAQLEYIHLSGIDLAGLNLNTQQAELIVTEDEIRDLEFNGIRGQLVEQIVQGFLPIGLDPRYYSPEKIETKLKDLHSKYPKLTRLEEIGKSIRGKSIYALLLSDTPDKDDPKAAEKPAVLFDGMHHAREVMSPEIPMDVAETLLAEYSADSAEAKSWLSQFKIWIVPMLNVDGNGIVWSGDLWWRKNAHADGQNVYGVDINRNYPYKWGACNGSSSSNNRDDYRGPSAGSEPETQAIAALAQNERPIIAASYHSFSELVLYPYGCDGEFTIEKDLFSTIGKELADLVPSDSNPQQPYTPGTPWDLLYSVDGDSIGYLYGQFGTLAFVFEINQSFQPKYELREPTVLKHRKAWKHLLNRASAGLIKVFTKDLKTGAPVKASIEINELKRTQDEMAYATDASGHFFKIVAPGDYKISATLPDQRKAEASVHVDGKSAVDVVIMIE